MAEAPRASNGDFDWERNPRKEDFKGISGPNGKREGHEDFVERRAKEIFEQSIRATKKAEPKPLNTAMPAGEGLVKGAQEQGKPSFVFKGKVTSSGKRILEDADGNKFVED